MWFDALLGYISFIGEKLGEKGVKKWWKNKAKIYHFLGKDNIPFHSIFWPAMLFAHGDFSLPFMICGYQYLLYEGRKFSKSKKRGVFCDKLLKNPEIDIEELRFYLTFLIPEKEDTSFSWEEFKEKVNNVLIGDIANFSWRCLNLAKNVKFPLHGKPDKVWKELSPIIKQYVQLMEKVEIRKGLNEIIKFASTANTYLSKKEPWKKDPASVGYRNIIYNLLEMNRVLAIMMYPFTPKFSEKLLKAIGLSKKELRVKTLTSHIKKYQRISLPKEAFFKKIEEKEIKKWKVEFSQLLKFEEIERIIKGEHI